MKSLNEDLKTGQLKKVYLLYGEEAYLKRQYRDKLQEALVSAEDKMNFARYEGKHIPVGEVIDLAETLPFFAQRRLIVLEDSGFFKSATPELADYLKEMPETTAMLFVESEVDKRSKLYKAVQSVGRAVELSKQDEAMLLRWIAGSVKREGKQISEHTIRHFLGKVGTDMENIQKELEKLFCYTLGREAITVEDIEEICTTQVTNQIFDMVNAVAEKRQRKALEYYYDLLALKEPPMRILFLLTRQFKQLLEVKEMDKKGYARKDIAAKVGLHPFIVGKYQEQARAFSSKALRKILEESVELEESVKTGTLTDTLGVELFLMKYSAKQN
ncbi:MAG: DNA polymerase III subunit delta [Faecalimonas sp.]|nr:DNA polymerase III subunit delta [Faecalimonas sp.]